MTIHDLVTRYVAFRRALGDQYLVSETTLHSFCRAIGPRTPITRIRLQTVAAYLAGTGPVTRLWHFKYAALKGLFQFGVSRGLLSVAPLPTEIPKCPPTLVPYIYSCAELRRLLDAISSFQNPCIRVEGPTLRSLLLLFYGAGLRRGEALRLTIPEVDLTNALLTIRHTKFGKTRLVPLSADLAEVLRAYARWRAIQHPATGATCTFFVDKRGEAVHRCALDSAFRRLRQRAGVRRSDGGRFQPRLHDLRHTFAVHRLTAWYRQGADVQRLVYHLSVYLGHDCLAHTQVYLTMIPELLQQASTRFERYAVRRIRMPNGALLGPWVRRFLLEHLVHERNLARNTQRSYRDTLRLLLPTLARCARKPVDRLAVSDLSAERLRQFLNELEEQRGCAIATRNQRLAAVHALARFIGLQAPEWVEWCGQITVVPFKKAPRSLITYLEKPEMEALLAAPDLTTAQGRREHALLLFLYNTGARADEAAQVRIRDLTLPLVPDRDQASVLIRGKGNKARQCPLWAQTVRELTSLVQGHDPSEPVFRNRCGQPMTRFGIHTLVERSCGSGCEGSAVTGS